MLLDELESLLPSESPSFFLWNFIICSFSTDFQISYNILQQNIEKENQENHLTSLKTRICQKINMSSSVHLARSRDLPADLPSAGSSQGVGVVKIF